VRPLKANSPERKFNSSSGLLGASASSIARHGANAIGSVRLPAKNDEQSNSST